MDVQKQEYQVYMSYESTECDECRGAIEKNEMLIFGEGKKKICIGCAELDHLVYVPSGDPALTKRARKESGVVGIVVKFSQSRKRNERQGILVEKDALERAEEMNRSDAEIRELKRKRAEKRRGVLESQYTQDFAEEIKKLYPRCPAGVEKLIAEHACEKYSGRIGRSEMAKNLSPSAIRSAVIAHVRHTETNYDEMLINNFPRELARERIQDRVDEVIAEWKATE